MVKNLLIIIKPMNSIECIILVFVETLLQLCEKHAFVLMNINDFTSFSFVCQLNYYTVKILLCISQNRAFSFYIVSFSQG